LNSAQLSEMQQTIDAKQLQDFLPGLRYGLGLMWRPLSCGGGYGKGLGIGPQMPPGWFLITSSRSAVSGTPWLNGDHSIGA
jgi:hypothetical protein